MQLSHSEPVVLSIATSGCARFSVITTDASAVQPFGALAITLYSPADVNTAVVEDEPLDQS